MTRHPSSYHCATTAMLKTHITHDFKPRHYILYVYFIIFIVEWKCVTAWSGVWASNSSQLYLYLILSLKLKCCHSNFSFKHDQMNMTFRETKETLEYPFMNSLQDCVLDRKCKMFWPIKLAIIPSYMVMLSWLLSRHCHWRLGLQSHTMDLLGFPRQDRVLNVELLNFVISTVILYNIWRRQPV